MRLYQSNKPAFTKKWTKWRMQNAIAFYESALKDKPGIPYGEVSKYKKRLHQLRLNLSHA